MARALTVAARAIFPLLVACGSDPRVHEYAGPSDAAAGGSSTSSEASLGSGGLSGSLSDGSGEATAVREAGGVLVVAVPGRPAIILDTDMGPDVDDAGALAILHAMEDRGEATLLGVMISTAGDNGNHAIGFVDAVNTYYRHPDLPIGLWKRGAFVSSGDGYPAVVSGDRATYPHDLGDESNAVPDAVALYRRILAIQPDGSVTVVCTGMMNVLEALLESGADDASRLAGKDLVRTKVALLVQMGGSYPSGTEFNFIVQPTPGTTRAAVEGWPTPITFSGFEIGESIQTGASLADLPADNPVRTAYRVYTNGGYLRPSWDLTAALYAVRGASIYWDVESVGSNSIDDTGRNAWQASPDLDQAYLVKKADDGAMSDVLNGLLTSPPLESD